MTDFSSRPGGGMATQGTGTSSHPGSNPGWASKLETASPAMVGGAVFLRSSDELSISSSEIMERSVVLKVHTYYRNKIPPVIFGAGWVGFMSCCAWTVHLDMVRPRISDIRTAM